MQTVELLLLIDRSTSLFGKEAEVLRCCEAILDRHKRDGHPVYVTTILFGSACRIINMHMPLAYMEKLTGWDYFTQGNTALLDAAVYAVQKMDEILEDVRPNPERIVEMDILTDGAENASIFHDAGEVRELLENKRKAGWRIKCHSMGGHLPSWLVRASGGEENAVGEEGCLIQKSEN